MQNDPFGFHAMEMSLAHTAGLIRAGSLYLPIALTGGVVLVRRVPLRTFASPLLSLLWTLPTLLLVQHLNLHLKWWSFDYPPAECILGMPVAMYLGWAVFWGLLPQFSFRFIGVRYVVFLAVVFDSYFMVLLDPALDVNRVPGSWRSEWLVGDLVAVFLVLVPALLIFRWTEENSHLGWRAAIQVALSGMIFLFLLPEITFALRPHTLGWHPLQSMSGRERRLWMQTMLLAAVPGISAVQEFVIQGRGTPIPYDPPQRLVTSGIYRFCANPMQLSCAVVMLLEAALLRNCWLALGALMVTVYSAGLAHWDENTDLAQRFSAGWQLRVPKAILPQSTWQAYRSAVPAWRLRWRPYHAGPPAILYLSATCQTCSGLRRFFERRDPVGLIFRDAEELASNSLRRLRYVPPADSPSTQGVLALAHALEHLHFGWAYCGFLLQLPAVHHAAEMLADCAGLGPTALTVQSSDTIAPIPKPQTE